LDHEGVNVTRFKGKAEAERRLRKTFPDGEIVLARRGAAPLPWAPTRLEVAIGDWPWPRFLAGESMGFAFRVRGGGQTPMEAVEDAEERKVKEDAMWARRKP
jgi:hypothetical protein